MPKIDQTKLFFIIGIGRSGTTLLQEIMNTFSGFCNDTESHINDDPMSESCWADVRRSRNFSNLESFIERKWTKENFVEKTPDSILCLPEMQERFPDARYLFLERDPLKIVLSQLNLFPGELDLVARTYHLKTLVMKEEDLKLNPEQYWAKLTLDQIHHQISYKKRFQHALTIRYESLVKSINSQLTLIENYFGIKADKEKAHEVLGRPSSGSRTNRYDIKRLDDPIAISMVKEASKLWSY